MEDRLNRFGEMVMNFSQRADRAKSIGGGQMRIEGEDLMKKYKQYVIKDGDDVFVDPAALQDKGFYDVLMSDKRVNSIVKSHLRNKGIEKPPATASVAEKKEYNRQAREELANIMTPFVDYEEVREDRSRVVRNVYAGRSSSSSSSKTGSQINRESLNKWYQDLMSFTPKSASYLEGATVNTAALPIDDPRQIKMLDTADRVVISRSRIHQDPSYPGGGVLELAVRKEKGDTFVMGENEDGVITQNEVVVTIPLTNIQDPERAAVLYQASKSSRKSNYEASKGVGSGEGQGSKPKLFLGGFNVEAGKFEK